MSGTKSRFMKKVNVDARKRGKKLADLTQEEVKKFSL